MTTQQAKTILYVYRPGTADEQDPEFAGALALARTDAELARWFEQHCTAQRALRASLRRIAAPEGLKEQILSERRVGLSRWRRPVALVAVAAAASVVLTAMLLWVQPDVDTTDEATLATYRSRMVGAVLRQYAMTLETADPAQIRAHLAERQSPSDYILTKGLEQAVTTGCGVLSWRDKPVSMVCFRSGRPLPPGEKTDLFLFVVDRDALPDAPAGGEPTIAKVNKLLTASWTHGPRVYVLAMEGDEALLRQYLN